MPDESKLTLTANFLTKIAGVTSTLRGGAGGKYVQASGMLGSIAADFNKRQENADILKAQRDIAQGNLDKGMMKTSRGYAATAWTNTYNQAFIGIHDYIAKGEMDNQSPEQMNQHMTKTYNELAQAAPDTQALNLLTRIYHKNQIPLMDMHGKRHNAFIKKQQTIEGERAVTNELELIKRGQADSTITYDRFKALVENVPIEEQEKLLINAGLAQLLNGNQGGLDLIKALPKTGTSLSAVAQAEDIWKKVYADQNRAALFMEKDRISKMAATGQLYANQVAGLRAAAKNELFSDEKFASLVAKSEKFRYEKDQVERMSAALVGAGDTPINFDQRLWKRALTHSLNVVKNSGRNPKDIVGVYGRMAERFPDSIPMIRKEFAALGRTGEFEAQYRRGEVPQETIDALKMARILTNYGNNVNAAAVLGPHEPMVQFCNDIMMDDNMDEAQAIKMYWQYKKDPQGMTPAGLKDFKKDIVTAVDNEFDDSWFFQDKPAYMESAKAHITQQAILIRSTTPGMTETTAINQAIRAYKDAHEKIGGTMYKKIGDVSQLQRLQNNGLPNNVTMEQVEEKLSRVFQVHTKEDGSLVDAKDLQWVRQGEELGLRDDKGRTIIIPNDKIVEAYLTTKTSEQLKLASERAAANVVDTLAMDSILEQNQLQMTQIFNKLKDGDLSSLSKRELNIFQAMSDVLAKEGVSPADFDQDMWNNFGRDRQKLLLVAASSKMGTQLLKWIEGLKVKAGRLWTEREKATIANLAVDRLYSSGGIPGIMSETEPEFEDEKFVFEQGKKKVKPTEATEDFADRPAEVPEGPISTRPVEDMTQEELEAEFAKQNQ